MKASEIYIKETGNKRPNNQIALHEWEIEYRKWLENKLLSSYEKELRLKEEMKKLFNDFELPKLLPIVDKDKIERYG